MAVFVTQHHLVRDRVTQALVDKYDLTDAKRYGNLIYCLDHGVDVRDAEVVINRLDNCLARYTEKDLLLLIGSPVLIGLAFTIAATNSPNGVVRCLQWTPSERRYLPLAFNMTREVPA